jgi:hypothetical protein
VEEIPRLSITTKPISERWRTQPKLKQAPKIKPEVAE